MSPYLGAVLAVVQVVRFCAIVQFLQYPLGNPGIRCAIISHSGHSQVQLFQAVISPDDRLERRCVKKACFNCTCAIGAIPSSTALPAQKLGKIAIITQLHTHTCSG